MTAQATQSESHEAAAQWLPLDAIHPWAKNPRPLQAKDVRELARSIRRFGFGAPIVARKANGEIIAGHGRYAAARRLKLDRVPVRLLDLSESEAHALALADNKLQELRDWDKESLARILEQLEADGVDMLVGTGFDEAEIDKLLDVDADILDGDGASAQLGGLEYRIVVECRDEMHQTELLDRFEHEGLRCKPLMS